MNISELLYTIKTVTFKDIVCQTKIQTEEDKHEYRSKGYMIDLTESEFRKLFPEIDPENIFYTPSISLDSFYFNTKTLAACPFQYRLLTFDRIVSKESFIKAIEIREAQVNAMDFRGSFSTLPDAMRLEYFEMLVNTYKNVPNLYHLFMSAYRSSDYGFINLKPEVMQRIIESKTQEDQARTDIELQRLPSRITVYRGGSYTVSAPADRGCSWSTDINSANFFVSRRGDDEGYIAVGEVEKAKVIETNLASSEKEILVDPNDVQITEMIHIKGFDSLEPVLLDNISMYQTYRDRMTNLNFAQDSAAHGQEHEARVLLMCLIIGHYLNLPQSDLRVLATAAIYHDTQRVNDGQDFEHGRHAKDYYAASVKKPDPLVEFLCEYHCLPDEEAYAHIKSSRVLSKNRSRSTMLYNVFKDADALDRVRFGIRDLDLNQLRLPISKTLPLVARINYEQIKVEPAKHRICSPKKLHDQIAVSDTEPLKASIEQKIKSAKSTVAMQPHTHTVQTKEFDR